MALAYIPDDEWMGYRQKAEAAGHADPDVVVSGYYKTQGLDAQPLSMTPDRREFEQYVNKALSRGFDRPDAESAVVGWYQKQGKPAPDYNYTAPEGQESVYAPDTTPPPKTLEGALDTEIPDVDMAGAPMEAQLGLPPKTAGQALKGLGGTVEAAFPLGTAAFAGGAGLYNVAKGGEFLPGAAGATLIGGEAYKEFTGKEPVPFDPYGDINKAALGRTPGPIESVVGNLALIPAVDIGARSAARAVPKIADKALAKALPDVEALRTTWEPPSAAFEAKQPNVAAQMKNIDAVGPEPESVKVPEPVAAPDVPAVKPPTIEAPPSTPKSPLKQAVADIGERETKTQADMLEQFKAQPYLDGPLETLWSSETGSLNIGQWARQAAEEAERETAKTLVAPTGREVTEQITPWMFKPVPLSQTILSPHNIAPIRNSGVFDLAVQATEKGLRWGDASRRQLSSMQRLLPGKAEQGLFREALIAGDNAGRRFSTAEIREMAVNAGLNDAQAKNVDIAYQSTRNYLDRLWQEEMKVSKRLTPEQVELYRVLQMQTKTEGEKLDFITRIGRAEAYDKAQVIREKIIKTEDRLKDPTLEKKSRWALTGYKGKLDKALAAEMYTATHYQADPSDIAMYLTIAPSYRQGYIPHIYHENMIYKIGADGSSTLVHPEGGTHTLREAVVWARANEKDLGAGDVYAIVPKSGRRLAEAEAQTFTEAKPLSVDDAERMLKNQATQPGFTAHNRHPGFLKQRFGAKNFDTTDIFKTLSDHYKAASRYIAMQEFKPQAIKVYESRYGAGSWDKNPAELGLTAAQKRDAQMLRDYISNVNGTPDRVEARVDAFLLRKIPEAVKSRWGTTRPGVYVANKAAHATAIAKLGFFNVASAAINLSQSILTFAKSGSIKNFAKGIDYALATRFGNKAADIDKTATREIRMLWRALGIDTAPKLAEAGAYTQSSYAGKAANATMYLFQGAETWNRRIAAATAYFDALDKGLPSIGRGQNAKATVDYVKDFLRNTQFDYSVADTPALWRNPFGRVWQQFGAYPIKYMEAVSGLRGMEIAKWAIPTLLFAGYKGIPGVSDVNALLEVAGKEYGFSPEAELTNAVISWMGENPDDKYVQIAGKQMLGGLGAALADIDVGARIGADSPFGMGDPLRKALGPVLGTAKAVGESAFGIATGDPNADAFRMIKDISPGAGNIAFGANEAAKAIARTAGNESEWAKSPAVEKTRTGELAREMKPGEPGYTGDVIRKVVGVRNVDDSMRMFEQKIEQKDRMKVSHLTKLYASAIAKGDEQEQAKLETYIEALAEKLDIDSSTIYSTAERMAEKREEVTTVPWKERMLDRPGLTGPQEKRIMTGN